MARDEQDDLQQRLESLGAERLARFLVEMGSSDAAVQARVESLALRCDPPRLAKQLRARLSGIKRGRRFISYGESFDFAAKLGHWLDDVESGLAAPAPEAAAELLAAFIEADARIFERVDDSTGSVGMEFSRACGLWARAAGQAPPSFDRVDRIYALHAHNDYGARDSLLDEAASVLDELELRRLARRYQDDLEAAIEAEKTGGKADHGRYAASAAMGQVAKAIGDPKLYERSVRIGSPRPNAIQAREIARQYLDFGPVEKAIEWLEAHGDPDLHDLAEAYEKLGDRQRSREIRGRIFFESLEPSYLQPYLDLLPERQRPAARNKAIGAALSGSAGLGAAARLLFALEEPVRAEALVVERREELTDVDYARLKKLAEAAERGGSHLTAVLCFRALTDQILAEGRSKAYRYARSYCAALERLDGLVTDWGGLSDHDGYMAGLRATHGRKSAFWRLFERT